MREHILVATDFSTPAKEMLASLDPLRAFGAQRVTLVYVRRKRYPTEDSAGHEKYYQTLLDEQASILRDDGWQVDVRNELGRASSKIIEVAGQVDADMIVLANRGRSAVEDVFLGSVATDVLERADRPVFLYCDRAGTVQERDTRLWDRIIHPTDFSPGADRALEEIPPLVHAYEVPVMLFHIVDDRYFGPQEGDSRKQQLDQRQRTLEDAGVENIDPELVFARPKRCITETMEHYPEALIVMGVHGHGWFEDLVLGGVARSVARRATNHLLFVPGAENKSE